MLLLLLLLLELLLLAVPPGRVSQGLDDAKCFLHPSLLYHTPSQQTSYCVHVCIGGLCVVL